MRVGVLRQADVDRSQQRENVGLQEDHQHLEHCEGESTGQRKRGQPLHPGSAVEQADGLVASAMKRLAEVFAEERSRLEQQWDRGDNVSTEDLRIALQRYRSFFQRLLSV